MTQPLRSVDTETRLGRGDARATDSTVVPAAGVVAEAMVALLLAGANREKFGGDHIDDVRGAIAAYTERVAWRRQPPGCKLPRSSIVLTGFMAAGKSAGRR